MREIKFRAWDGKKLWDGDHIVFRNDISVATGVTTYNINGFFTEMQRKGWKFSQFTGEKDKKGVNIYEGDILKLEFEDDRLKPRVGVVEFGISNDSDGWAQENTRGWIVETGTRNDPNGWARTYFTLEDKANRCKIIGNIYENPELLTQ